LEVGSGLTTFQNKIENSTKCYTWPQIGTDLIPYARRKVETLKEIDYLINAVLGGKIILKWLLNI